MAYIPQQVLDTSGFGEVAVAQPTQKVMLSFAYNINTDLVSTTTANGGTVTQSAGHAVLSTSTNTAGSAILQSDRVLKYNTGQGALVRFTAKFTTGVASNTQIIGVGNGTDGFFFGYNGTSFGICRRSGGSDTWTAQTSWNADVFDGTGGSGITLDQTKGNVYQIRYQWLGYGAIEFSIENPTTGEFVLCHRIVYANANTATSISNPSLPLYVQTINAGSSTDVTISTPSMSAFVEGKEEDLGLIKSIGNAKTSITTETNIFSLQNKASVFGGSSNNRTPLMLRQLSIAADTNAATAYVTFRLLLNTSLGGSPSYTDINTNTSIASYDTAGTTVSGGTEIARYYLPKDSANVIDLTPLNFELQPGDIITVAAASSSTADIGCSLNWLERL